MSEEGPMGGMCRYPYFTKYIQLTKPLSYLKDYTAIGNFTALIEGVV